MREDGADGCSPIKAVLSQLQSLVEGILQCRDVWREAGINVNTLYTGQSNGSSPGPPEPLGEATPVMHSCLPHTCIQRPKSPAAQTRLGFGNKAKSCRVVPKSVSFCPATLCSRR